MTPDPASRLPREDGAGFLYPPVLTAVQDIFATAYPESLAIRANHWYVVHDRKNSFT